MSLAPSNETITRRRLDRGLSQAELGYRIGVSRETINRWERGDVRQIDPSYWQPLADVLGGKAGEYATPTRRIKPARDSELRREVDDLKARIDELVKRLADASDD